jgi:uncharacterized membrane protein YdjX (TVP38/TMEM64 family)
MAFIMLVMPMVGTITLAYFVFLQPLGDWLRTNWEAGAVIYFVATVLLCGLSLMPTNVIGLIGGWSFGFWLGLGVLMAAIVGAAVLSFLIHSRISGGKLPETIARYQKAGAIYQALLRDDYYRTTSIIFLLRVSIIIPFAFTNFLLASARVPLSSYIIGTFAGMLPRSATMVFAGVGLASLDTENPRDMIAIIVGIAATIVSVIVIARLSRNALLKIASDADRQELRPEGVV